MKYRPSALGSLFLAFFVQKIAAESYFNRNSPYGILQNYLSAETLELPVGTCNEHTPCVNGACCSKITKLCGYSPTECGAGNCTSNCDAKAECGKYGQPGKQNCPLGVCCSKFGFCGSTSDFCDAGCQKGFGGCGDVKRPSCSKDGGSVSRRSIGYYESWANTRSCHKVSPEDLNLDGLTHLNFAFVFFDPVTFQIIPMDKNAGSLLNRFTKLKQKKSGLETWVSVGGWSFNDPGPYQKAFSDMAMTAENRKRFIDGLLKFMKTYGFDGMDLDWEYPTAADRGGRAEDSANFVLLSKEIKAAFGSKYGYSITLPASYWYLQHFDLAKHQPHVDWFNLMSYDLHGVWDAASKWIGPKVAAHTNITEIDMGLDLLWRAGLKPEKVVLGQGCKTTEILSVRY
ncbi:family 18 glycosyl hydrolase [Stachybotrys elegans]|uniref:chitinase n=1 Tax=Stachybotrys elegans TaxID=80388 RepID=A0A8K0SVI1_9HYPO|nr:family 18 glycosyl hydrolase [Stachybotrys elegans]